MSEPSQVEADLTAAQAAINRARDLLNDGNEVDLTGLDGCVAKLCKDIAALPEGQRAIYKPRLVGMIDNLNSLVESLSVQHKELGAALKNVSSRQRAVNAYSGTPDGSTPRKTNK